MLQMRLDEGAIGVKKNTTKVLRLKCIVDLLTGAMTGLILLKVTYFFGTEVE